MRLITLSSDYQEELISAVRPVKAPWHLFRWFDTLFTAVMFLFLLFNIHFCLIFLLPGGEIKLVHLQCNLT